MSCLSAARARSSTSAPHCRSTPGLRVARNPKDVSSPLDQAAQTKPVRTARGGRGSGWILAALTGGDVHGLMDVLAPDVVVVVVGGGLVAAARHPIVGADTVVEFLPKFSTLAPTAVVDTL